MKELWKDVVGYEGQYKVSNYGRVMSLPRMISCHKKFTRRHPGGMMKPGKCLGYKMVHLRKNGVSYTVGVHRLVLIAFVGIHPKKPFVNHIDNNRWNATLKNLEWCTQSENMKHAYKTGQLKTPWSVKIKRNDGQIFLSLASAARDIGARTSHIWEHLNKKPGRKHIKGFTFSYFKENP